jgi:hypothetical protein
METLRARRTRPRGSGSTACRRKLHAQLTGGPTTTMMSAASCHRRHVSSAAAVWVAHRVVQRIYRWETTTTVLSSSLASEGSRSHCHMHGLTASSTLWLTMRSSIALIAGARCARSPWRSAISGQNTARPPRLPPPRTAGVAERRRCRRGLRLPQDRLRPLPRPAR